MFVQCACMLMIHLISPSCLIVLYMLIVDGRPTVDFQAEFTLLTKGVSVNQYSIASETISKYGRILVK